MSIEILFKEICQLIAKIRKVPSLADSINLQTDLIEDAGLDSLDFTELIFRMEDELALKIDLDALTPESVRTVQGLLSLISSKEN